MRLVWGEDRHDLSVHDGPEGTVVAVDGRRLKLRLEGSPPVPSG